MGTVKVNKWDEITKRGIVNDERLYVTIKQTNNR